MKRGTRLRILTLVPFLLPALSGCIASYSLQSENDSVAAPDLSAACSYKWTTKDSWFRAESVYSYKWGPPGAFGYRSLESYVQELPGNCPEAPPAGAIDATLSAHYLEYSNAFARGAAILPLSYLSGLTLGFLPYALTDYYAVCVEAGATDGLRRAGLAKGRMDSVTNVWGASNTRQHRGRDEKIQKREELMRDLTMQAWHKAWMPSQQGATPIASCREALDAIVQQQ